MLFTTRGYVAKYKGTDVYVVPEEEYEMKNPELIYVLYRDEADQFMMVRGGRIVGTMNRDGSYVFWDTVGNPDFALAGFYDNLEDRRKAYKALEGVTAEAKRGLFENSNEI